MEKILEVVNTILGQHGLNDLVHKSSTHGGEWTGSCPRCATLGMPGKNEDRLQVWPHRSLDGMGSREEPCFYCRVCKRADDPSKPWTGDLIEFVRGTLGLSYYQARGYLELENGADYEGSVELKPLVSVTGAPPEKWQQRAAAFAAECRDRLWTEEGAPARAYLIKRGIAEETMRWAVLGCVAEGYYEDGELWGRDGRIYIPRGIVFVEYHVVVKDGVVYREIWSISIRRPDGDLRLEEIQTGNKAAKYHFIAGSVKGLYLSDTIVPDKPLLLVEGQMCALTIWQEAGDVVSVAAIQSATGGHSLTWIARVLLALYVMIGMDPDAAGELATEYWKDIPAEKRFPWPAPNGDFNAMHMRGEPIRQFILNGKRMFESIIDAIGGISGPSFDEEVLDEAEVAEDHLSLISEPNRGIVAQGEPEHIESNEPREACFVCGADTSHIVEGIALCVREFAAMKLLQGGRKFSWGTFKYPGGDGLVDPLGPSWQEAPEGSVKAGKSMYLDFIKTHSPASIWLAASEVTYRSSSLFHEDREDREDRADVPRIRRYVDTPCARKACSYDARESVQLHQGRVRDANGKEEYNGAFLRPPARGRMNIVDGKQYHWCPRCTDCSLILDLGAFLRYPRVQSGSMLIHEGRDNWIALCQDISDHDATCYLDMLRTKFPDAWKQLQQLL